MSRVQLQIELKRVQTFIFEVPRLKAMLGANALIGQTMRHALPGLLGTNGIGHGVTLDWPDAIAYDCPQDPLSEAKDPSDRDDPKTLFQQGILARDGGHFIVVFEGETQADAFLREAEATLARMLPGVLYEHRIDPFPPPEKRDWKPPKVNALHRLDLPVLQVCQETGNGPASDPKTYDNEKRWQACSVTLRQDWGDRFYAGGAKDIIGLMHAALYPDQAYNWTRPSDLKELVSGDYLALIHADGNAIGKRYKAHRDKLKGQEKDAAYREAHGEAFFHGMRVIVRRAVVDALRATFAKAENPTPRPYEVLMLGGDDLLMLCRADQALTFANRYAAELDKYRMADGGKLDVAIGIAIAQKGYPLHRLHDLAESLAASAKRLWRGLDDPERTSVIDWQVVTQSWFEGVAEARRQGERIDYAVAGRAESLVLSDRPYRVLGDDGLQGLLGAAEKLDTAGKEDEKAARSPLRGLRGACERGRLSGEMAFNGLSAKIRAQLGWKSQDAANSLWRTVQPADGGLTYITRALDIIDIREISHLGSKAHD